MKLCIMYSLGWGKTYTFFFNWDCRVPNIAIGSPICTKILVYP